ENVMRSVSINKISKKSVISRQFDWFLLILTFMLSVFGVIAIYSATRTSGTITNVIVQSASVVIGTAAAVVLCFFDYEQFKNLIRPVYIFAVAILILVLLIGSTGGGAKSWIRIGAVSIQSAEFAKICYTITFSYHLAAVEDRINKPLILLGLVLHLVPIAALIMLQPDLGSLMVFVFMFMVLLFTAKLSYKYIIPVTGLGIISIPLIYNYMLTDYQQQRINVFLNPELEPMDGGYNVIQSKLAVGAGQIFGDGYLNGVQNQMGYLPAKSTDFIFSTIAEEWGFIGAIILTAALFIVIWRCFTIARRADNSFGRYICTSVGAMFLFHTVENIGMCIGITPVTGIPLPFITYGGSSMVTNLAAIGLVMSVEYHNKPRSAIDVY
ncbi:MAG: rod shape-determining protein RodA, partial [Firmicutes bacterium]|nr:rod shape-determining protein RodA [Bacillota bacterium]